MRAHRVRVRLAALLLALAARAARVSGVGAGAPARAVPGTAPGVFSDASFFPLAVWRRDLGTAEAYRALGVNTFVMLQEGPTEEQLAKLARAGLSRIELPAALSLAK